MAVAEIVNHLSAHTQLVTLDLSGNNLGNAVHRLIEHVSTQTLDCLQLANINMTRDGCERLLRKLNKYENLIYLNLGENNLTGQLSHFLCDPGSTLPSLRYLDLTNVGLNKDDVNHLKTLLESGKMPALGGLDDTDVLWLDKNNLAEMVDELESLLQACLNYHYKELKIGLFDNNLSDEFVEKWTKRCEGTHVGLFF